MIWFILYLVSIPIVGLGFFYINSKIKWLTKSDFEGFNADFAWLGLILGILFWPIALICLLIVFICELIKTYLIPKD